MRKKAQDVGITRLYDTTQLGGLPPHKRTQAPPPVVSPVATRSALSACCFGTLCLPRVTGVGGLCLSLATKDLQCNACLDNAARLRLLQGMLQVTRLSGFHSWRRRRRTPLPWLQKLSRITIYVTSLAPTLAWMEVALPAILSNTVTSELAGARPASLAAPLPGDPDALVWSLYLLHHDRFAPALQALWRAIPRAARPQLSSARGTLFGLGREAPHQPQCWLREGPSAPSLRCCSPLCAPGSTAKKSTSAPRYRQAFQAHMCDRCVLQWNKAKAVLCTHAAVAQARQRPLAPVLQTIVASIPTGLSGKALTAAFQAVVSTPLQKLLGHVVVLEAYYCLLHDTSDALLQRGQSPSKRPSLSITPSWFQDWSRAHPYEAPPPPASDTGGAPTSAPAAPPVVRSQKRRRRARYRPPFKTQPLRPYSAADLASRRRRPRQPAPPVQPVLEPARSRHAASAARSEPSRPGPPLLWQTLVVLATAITSFGLSARVPLLRVQSDEGAPIVAPLSPARRGPPPPPPPGLPG